MDLVTVHEMMKICQIRYISKMIYFLPTENSSYVEFTMGGLSIIDEL